MNISVKILAFYFQLFAVGAVCRRINYALEMKGMLAFHFKILGLFKVHVCLHILYTYLLIFKVVCETGFYNLTLLTFTILEQNLQ